MHIYPETRNPKPETRNPVIEIKMASYLHRTAQPHYPCYLPILGELSRSWSYKTCRCKYNQFTPQSTKACFIFSEN